MNLPESAKKKIALSNGDININVGSGTDTKPSYINYDIRPSVPEVDIVDDVRNIDKYFAEGTVTNILCFQIFEHFSRNEWVQILAKLCKLLRPEGRIHIRAPAVVDVVSGYLQGKWTVDDMFWTIYGGQHDYGDAPPFMDYHKSGITIESLRQELERNGLVLEEANHVYGARVIHCVAIKKVK